ncbi:hypothetical protein HMPREF3208_00976 [Gardnerella vaginalis]|uniref:Uncharacterized protein n=1 Tax=Gardnerella vaginalis TaxID=2702 RepID=A0A133NU13_GARVA|nr:hypothetical protein HMPREF3208_00976 [Gardnerella vaginalis]
MFLPITVNRFTYKTYKMYETYILAKAITMLRLGESRDVGNEKR